MKGGFICPYCKTTNACDCAACTEYIQEGEFVNKWTEDGEGLICGNCAKVYSPDQSLEQEWEERLEKQLPKDLNEWRKNADPSSLFWVFSKRMWDLLEHHIIDFVKEFQHSFKSFSERGFVKNMVMTPSFIVCEFGILAFKIFS